MLRRPKTSIFLLGANGAFLRASASECASSILYARSDNALSDRPQYRVEIPKPDSRLPRLRSVSASHVRVRSRGYGHDTTIPAYLSWLPEPSILRCNPLCS